MQMVRIVLSVFFLAGIVLAQTADTATGHKAAATALLNSNNTGAARLACPASISAVPSSNPPGGGPPRAAGDPGRGGRGRGARLASTPPRDAWYAEGGQVFDNLYLLTKMNSAGRSTPQMGSS